MAGDSFWHGPQEEDQKLITTGLPRSALSRTLPGPSSGGRSNPGAGLVTREKPTAGLSAAWPAGPADAAGRDHTRHAATTAAATPVATAMARQCLAVVSLTQAARMPLILAVPARQPPASPGATVG